MRVFFESKVVIQNVYILVYVSTARKTFYLHRYRAYLSQLSKAINYFFLIQRRLVVEVNGGNFNDCYIPLIRRYNNVVFDFDVPDNVFKAHYLVVFFQFYHRLKNHVITTIYGIFFCKFALFAKKKANTNRH